MKTVESLCPNLETTRSKNKDFWIRIAFLAQQVHRIMECKWKWVETITKRVFWKEKQVNSCFEIETPDTAMIWVTQERGIVHIDSTCDIETYSYVSYVKKLLRDIGLDITIDESDWWYNVKPCNRMTHMQFWEKYYWDSPEYLEDNKDRFNLSKNLANRAYFIQLLEWIWFADNLPNTTIVNSFKDAGLSFVKLLSIWNDFCIKAWEWKAWENMIFVKFIEIDGIKCVKVNNLYTSDSGKIIDLSSWKQLLEEFNKAFPKNNRYSKTIFPKDWEVTWNVFKEKQKYVIHEKIDLEWKRKGNINYVIWNNWIYLTTSCSSTITEWIYLWNQEQILPHFVYEKSFKLAQEIRKLWFLWEIGFEFIYNDSWKIIFLEANPYFNTSFTSAMFIQHMKNKWFIKNNNMWRTVEKVKVPKGLNLLTDARFNRLNFMENIKKWKAERWWFFCLTPIEPSNNLDFDYQTILFIWDDDESLNFLYKELTKKIRNT